MKRVFSFGLALALLSSAFAACTMDFDQFQPGLTGGAGGTGTAGMGGSAGNTGTAGTTNCAADCCAATDCPSNDPCLAPTCDAGNCGTKAVEDGMAAPMQTAGDCQKAVCLGGKIATS